MILPPVLAQLRHQAYISAASGNEIGATTYISERSTSNLTAQNPTS
jgi:hypothetical protein